MAHQEGMVANTSSPKGAWDNLSRALMALGQGQLWAQPTPTVGSSPAQMGLGAQKRSSGGWVAPPGSNPPGPLDTTPPLDGPLRAAGRAQGTQPAAPAGPEGDSPSQGTPRG